MTLRSARRALAFVVLAALPACSVPEFDASVSEPTPNTCEADSDCGDNGRCEAGACRATVGTFTTVLFEVTPPSDATTDETGKVSPIAGLRFFKLIEQLSPTGGLQNIALDHIAHVTGNVIPAGCEASAAAKITFTPSERLLGLSTSGIYTAEVKPREGFGTWLPPGTYDMYVQRNGEPTETCNVVPQLVRKHVIPAGDYGLEIQQPVPALLKVTIAWPEEISLVGWTLDVVDPITGRVISERRTIDEASYFQASTNLLPDGRLGYVEPGVRYIPVSGPDSGAPGAELVRLSPPEGVVMPKLLVQRSALELFSQGEGMMDQIMQLPPMVSFAGRVTTVDPDQAVAGTTVTLIATQIEGLAAGTLASFEREVTTNADGSFAVDLLAGEYRVHAVPPGGSGYAAKVGTLEIASYPTTQSGKLIQLEPTAVLSGRVFNPAGTEPVSGASVHAVATPTSIHATELQIALGDKPFVPRASTSCEQNALCNVVGKDGLFSIEADPGRFDVSVRPPESTGFSWLVRPNVLLAHELDLRQLNMPAPVGYSGRIFAPDGAPIPRALIRAYVYMARDSGYVSSPESAASVLQIGETRAGDDAGFTLLLPSGLK